MRFVGGDLLLHHLAPGRIFRRLVEQRAPILDRRLKLSVLLLGDGEQDARLQQRLIEFHRAPERGPRFFRHHPIIGEHQGLALPRQTLRRFSQQPDRLTVGVSRIAIAPPAHIDRGYRVPPLALLGVLSEPRFDAGDERFEILVARRDLAGARQAAGPASGESRKRDRGRARAAATRPRRRSSPSWRGRCRLKSFRMSQPCCRRQAGGARSRPARPRLPPRRSARARGPTRSRRADRDRRLKSKASAEPPSIPRPASGRSRTSSTIAVRQARMIQSSTGKPSLRTSTEVRHRERRKEGQGRAGSRRLIPRNPAESLAAG